MTTDDGQAAYDGDDAYDKQSRQIRDLPAINKPIAEVIRFFLPHIASSRRFSTVERLGDWPARYTRMRRVRLKKVVFFGECLMKYMPRSLSGNILFVSSAALFIFVGKSYADAVVASPNNDLAWNTGTNATVAFTTGGSWDATHGPDKLNDGNEDGNFYENPTSLYHSAGPAPQIMFGVILAQQAVLGEVDIYVRTDVGPQRIDTSDDGKTRTPFQIQIVNGADPLTGLGGTVAYSQSDYFNPDINKTASDGSPALGERFYIPAVAGKTVRIVQNSGSYATIAEVEAYAVPVPSAVSAGMVLITGIGLVTVRRRRALA